VLCRERSKETRQRSGRYRNHPRSSAPTRG
jgi:hypothetical protein